MIPKGKVILRKEAVCIEYVGLDDTITKEGTLIVLIPDDSLADLKANMPT